jgi:RNA polymerase sigma-70 factor (ECF subfamily)
LEQYENNDRKKFVQLAMQHLKDDERICLNMYYLNEFKVNEIHELTGISPANIKVLLYRGRKNLYQQLERLLKAEINNLI